MQTRVWKYAGTGVALFIVAASLMNLYAFYAPKSALGWTRFRIEYASNPDKSAYLDAYRSRTWEHGGGYIPDDVARFLNTRLENSTDPREISAVTRFYSLQAGGREPISLFTLSDKARRRVATTVLHEWKSYPANEAQHGLVLLEELWQNTFIGKADVRLPQNHLADSLQKLAPVVAVFHSWNTKYATTPFTKRPDPLKGTPYSIEGL